MLCTSCYLAERRLLIVRIMQTMYKAVWTPDQQWQGGLEPYQCLQLEPAAQVLNYGQSVFEGLKAQRSAKGRVVLFRPQDNAARMAEGATPFIMLCSSWTHCARL